jgi:aminoglycoside phosphotransferase (APT) family kinase protein
MISQTESACLSASGNCVKEPGLSALFRWMETNVPYLYADQPIRIIHGDIRASNLYCITISLAVKPDCITLTGSIA